MLLPLFRRAFRVLGYGRLHHVEGQVLLLAGEEKDLALDVVKTAVAENPEGTPEQWQQHVLAWAEENGSGEYRPGYWDSYERIYEYNDFLRSIGWL